MKPNAVIECGSSRRFPYSGPDLSELNIGFVEDDDIVAGAEFCFDVGLRDGSGGEPENHLEDLSGWHQLKAVFEILALVFTGDVSM